MAAITGSRDEVGESEARTFVDPVTGQVVRQLTNSDRHSVHAYYDNPPWSPVTGRIAFSRRSPGARSGEIYVMDADGGHLTQVGRSAAMSPNDGAMAQWSGDGRRVFFRDHDGARSVVTWVDVETGETQSWPGSLRMVRPVGNEQVYSTDHTRLPDEEVVSGRREHGVFVQDLATGESRRIVTVADALEIHPRRDEVRNWHLYIKHTKWSPSGERLMFVFTNEIHYEGKYAESPRVKDVYVVNADGTGLKRVGEFGNHPLWHPNGRQILTNSPFEGRPGNSLVLLDAGTGARELATTAMAGSGHPSYSPDGQWILVDHVLPAEGHGSLNLIHVPTGQTRHLVQLHVTDHSHVGTHLHPVWSRDGRQILYASDATGTAQLCVTTID